VGGGGAWEPAGRPMVGCDEWGGGGGEIVAVGCALVVKLVERGEGEGVKGEGRKCRLYVERAGVDAADWRH